MDKVIFYLDKLYLISSNCLITQLATYLKGQIAKNKTEEKCENLYLRGVS